MDTLTHALSGMLLARATRKQNSDRQEGLSLRSRMAAGFLASAFPDIDFIFWFFGDVTYLNHHRGITHSVLLLPFWAWLLSMGFAGLWRGRYHWQQFYLVSALGIAIHILGDVITAFGTMILAPFSMLKFAFPTTFILDPWFTGIILLSLLLAWAIKPKSRSIAVGGLLMLVGYIGYQAMMQQKAITIAESYRDKNGLANARIDVLPQFLLPHHWKLLISHKDEYHVAYVNVMKQKTDRTAASKTEHFIAMVRNYYQPRDQLDWLVHPRFGKAADSRALARQIWSLDIFNDIREFMKFPALDRIEQRKEGICAVFIDHRFVIDKVRIPPFQFGACRDKRNSWSLYRFKAGSLISLN